jgi:cyclomaltodextrinase
MYYSSRDERCKSPFGAARCGAGVPFNLRCDAQEGFSACQMLLRHDFSGTDEVFSLPRTGADCFSGVYTAPSAPDLLWYAFRFTRADGSYAYFDKNGASGADTPARWQLTVYDASRPTPAWFGRGVTYQIFPDRFCRLSVPDPDGMVGDRRVHQSWDELPAYAPDADGIIRNNDFFGGSLPGIAEKLPYLQSLGVSTLYLCPIFESASNHRYNTADYEKIDPMLGTEADFTALCDAAKARGIRVILDGVFNHTGSVSRYFNQDGFYPAPGAAQSQDSPYYNWYHFRHWPDDYEAWWGVSTLPAVEEHAESYRDFIFGGKDSVVRRWLHAGASGWRLDVADELPDDFIAGIRDAASSEKPDALLLGEVWEDGSNKIAYSARRRYLLGDETHGLMNYPFRTALLAYLRGGDAAAFADAMETIRENYPPPAFYAAMNLLGTHDTPRILTLLGISDHTDLNTKEQRAAYRLNEQELAVGLDRLRLAARILYAFPGSPTIFYGDEAGMQGFEDPLNRGTYPWGRENAELVASFRALGQFHRAHPALQSGSFAFRYAAGGGLVFLRQTAEDTVLCACNASDAPLTISFPWRGTALTDSTGALHFPAIGQLTLTLPPRSGTYLI